MDEEVKKDEISGNSAPISATSEEISSDLSGEVDSSSESSEEISSDLSGEVDGSSESSEEISGSPSEELNGSTLQLLEEPRLFLSTPFDDYTVSEGLLLSILLALVFGALWKFVKEVL